MPTWRGVHPRGRLKRCDALGQFRRISAMRACARESRQERVETPGPRSSLACPSRWSPAANRTLVRLMDAPRDFPQTLRARGRSGIRHAAMFASNACAVQMFDVAFSRRMCCSRVPSERRKRRLAARESFDTPTSRPGIWRLKASRVAKNAACGPPKPSGTPKRCALPMAMSAPNSPGGFNHRQREQVRRDHQRASQPLCAFSAKSPRNQKCSHPSPDTARAPRKLSRRRQTSSSDFQPRPRCRAPVARVRTISMVCG